MSVSNKAFSFLSLCGFLLTISTLTTLSDSAIDTYVFAGCSQLKYTPGSSYENSVNSILTSLVNSAMFTTYNNFTNTGSTQQDTVYGLFQCRGDLQENDCAQCVARSVSQLGTLCVNSCGGALQLEGCFVKYDNTTFLGVEDKTVVSKKCGAPTIGYDSDALTRRDAVLAYLGTGDGGAYKTFRSSTSGDLQGVAQCVGDLSAGECQDCLTDAIGMLKTECGTAAWGDMFLAKCYVRYTGGGVRSHTGEDYNYGNGEGNDDHEWDRTLAIIIGGIAAVGLLIIFLSFLNKHFEKGCK
ncbi:hypothetical protein I3843_06G045600 [Carya illinoinensis]|nr:hypothetical protein I3843_06G045600 [Carya illinoinensis]